MSKFLSDWIDARTGYRGLVHEALYEPIPGGARWRYVFGSALTAAFGIQLFTGVLLMLSYSPSSTTAWGSVFYIDEMMAGGWFLRGLHHFGSQAMIVLLGLHLVQVLIAGAYRAPREVNWWFGIALMFLTLGFSLTGYLLPWDQKGYWATKVATNIAGGTPWIGPAIQKVLVGGAEYGNQTLTRFYALHVGILPALLIVCLVIHVALFRKHGVTPPRHAQGTETFWPRQFGMDMIASFVVFAVLVGIVFYFGGAHLDAPADPSSADYPARPEWQFLSLFQMLKFFPGEYEVVGTIIVPGAIVALLLILPLLDKVIPHRLAHFLACGIVFVLIGGSAYLTYDAIRDDLNDPAFRAARVQASAAAERALELARAQSIPPEGARYLLLTDPYTHGRAVLEQKCLSCHYYGGQGQPAPDSDHPSMNPQVAADLQGFGTYEWIRGLLDDPASPAYFGTIPELDGMEEWKRSTSISEEELDDVARFVADFAKIPPDMTPLEWLEDPEFDVLNHPGLEPFMNDCGPCHIVGEMDLLTEGGLRDAPNLFAWGSPQWIRRMITKPDAPDMYGYLDEEHRMPAFPEGEQLTANDLDTVIRYLQGDYLPPGGSHPPATPPVPTAGANRGPESDQPLAETETESEPEA